MPDHRVEKAALSDVAPRLPGLIQGKMDRAVPGTKTPIHPAHGTGEAPSRVGGAAGEGKEKSSVSFYSRDTANAASCF